MQRFRSSSKTSMMIMAAAVVVVLGHGGAARADGGADASLARAGETRVAFGVSAPWGWFSGTFGGSVLVGVGGRHAVRANVARYSADDDITSFAAGVLADAEDAPRTGRILDVGASWVMFHRALWQGFTLELGALRRDRDYEYQPEFDDHHEVHTVTYGGRTTIGWSWLIKQRAFVAVGVGLSVGHERGTETLTPDVGGMAPVTRSVSRANVDAEGYFRIGIAFGR